MVQILDGKKVAQEVIVELKEKIKRKGITLHLGIILVGDDPASMLYTSMKLKRCEEVGIIGTLYHFLSSISESELLEKMIKINNENEGVIVQLPLPSNLSRENILNAIDPEKDVDGLTSKRFGNIVCGGGGIKLIPATPKGIIRLLDVYGISLEGKHVVIINHSNLIGKPLALLLLERNATVTVCHAYTQQLADITLQADILITAVGKAGLIKKEMVKENAVIIDAGVAKVDGKIYGDVDFNEVAGKVSFITPVPGGVGPMTIAMLLENLVDKN